MMKKACAEDAHKSMKAAEALFKYGFDFVPVIAKNAQHRAELFEQLLAQLDEIERKLTQQRG